jgi:hypothetical protein
VSRFAIEEYEEAFRVLITRAAVGKVGLSSSYTTQMHSQVLCVCLVLMVQNCAGAAAPVRAEQPPVSHILWRRACCLSTDCRACTIREGPLGCLDFCTTTLG